MLVHWTWPWTLFHISKGFKKLSSKTNSISFLKTQFYLIYLFGFCWPSSLWGFFSNWGRQGLLSAVHGLLTATAPPVAEHGLRGKGLQQLWHSGLVVMAHKLPSTGSGVVAHWFSCFVACGVFPDQDSNLCLLHWQEGSLPLSHQGCPQTCNFWRECTSTWFI